MFIYGADFFLYRPGLVLAAAGLVGLAALSFGPVQVGSIALTLHTQFLAAAIAIIGLSSTYMGIVAKVANDLTGHEADRWLSRLRYNRSFLVSAILALVGLVADVFFLLTYIRRDFSVTAGDVRISHIATTGLFLIVIGFLTFTATLVVHAVAARTRRV
jgi:Kef-type K+ transport system membrane component KefB